MLAALRVLWARILGFLRPGELDRDFAEELEAHLALAEEEKISQGLTPAEARRRARVELGGLTQLREAGREARGLPAIETFWLDVKLGFRMLRKTWGLTLIGGLAMTIAITIGVVIFWFLESTFFASLPLAEGDRVVAIQTFEELEGRRHETSRFDLERWGESLRTVVDFGAFQTVERNLVTGDGRATPVAVAEMTASGFGLARIPPLLGRPLLEADEHPGAPPVVVIGHDVWRSRFSADPEMVGKSVRLGGAEHTVVGVMPEGFAFPVNHSFWTPLRLGQSPFLGDSGGEGAIFGRLAPGVSLERVRAEVAALGLLASEDPALADRELQPRVVPYTFAFTGDFEPGAVSWVARLTLFAVALLLLPPCANIAILVYARTITRQEEFASRFALGASRGRLVGQIFLEILVLAATAAIAALGLASAGGVLLRRSTTRAGDGVPFWVDFSLSYKAVIFAAFLALLGATVAGVLPALKATGRQMQSSFRALGSRTGLRLGATWTVLVVAQVALTLAALPTAIEMGWGTVRKGVLGPGFAAEDYLTASLSFDGDEWEGAEGDGAAPGRFAALLDEVVRSLESEPEVMGVSAAASVLGDESWAQVEVEGLTLPEDGALLESRDVVRFNRVDEHFFGVFQVPVLTGRAFEAGDFASGPGAVVVNQTFARLLFGDVNPLGYRLRYLRALGEATAESPERWHEIVGVVADRPDHASHGTIYHPRTSGSAGAVSLAVRAGASPAALADRLRALVTELDPALKVDNILTLDSIYRDQQVGNNVGAISIGMVTLSVLLLSAAGIYALMSFTVNDRRREIGIRSALGARPRRLLLGIFGRALLQVGAGALIGSLLALSFDAVFPIEQAGGWSVPGVIPASAAFMALVGALAALGPARRGLRVDPIEELREG